MKTYIITITEEAPLREAQTATGFSGGQTITHYTRRANVADINPVISALDASLKAIPAPRKTRSDAGKKKPQPPQQ